MLQVSKRAATEAEAKDILDASRRVRNPFGVPVLLIDPKDYARKTFLGLPLPRPGIKKRIHEELAEVIAQCPLPATVKTDVPGASLLFEDRGYFQCSPKELESKILRIIEDFEIQGHDYAAKALPNAFPRMSVTIHSTNSLHSVLQESDVDSRRQYPDYPGYDAQHSFLSLWHEHTHSVSGTNEAGADKVAALMARYAFEDCTFLAVHADMRAVESLLHYDDPKLLNLYGWPCVEVTDAALALEAPPTWDDIKAVAETSYNTPHKARIDDILAVGTVFNDRAGLAFLFKDMKGMAEIAEECLKEGVFTNPEQIKIAERFALATRRLLAGTPAYQNPPATPSP